MTERTPEPAPGTHADGPTTVLLAVPGDDERDSGACADLAGVPAPARTDLLLVSLGGDADGGVRSWSDALGEPPAKVGVVTVEDERGAVVAGGGTHAAGGDGPGTGEESRADEPVVRTVSDPLDLQDVGEAVVSFLSSWAGDGNRTVVCFRSVDAVLEHDTPERTAKFLEALAPHLEKAGAVGHFHADVGSLDQSAFETLEPHFDEVVDATGSGRDDGDRAGGFVFPAAESAAATGVPSPAENGETGASSDVDAPEPESDVEAAESNPDVDTPEPDDGAAPQSEVESAIVRVEQDGSAVDDAGAAGAAASTGVAVDGPPSHSTPGETQRDGGGSASGSLLVTLVVGVVAVAAIAGAIGFFAPGSPAGEDGPDRGAVVGASNATTTATQTARATETAAPTATATPPPTPTPTPTATPTPTPTPTPTATPTASPTETETETETETDDGVIGGLL